MTKKIDIYDTTLRDGTQRRGVSLSAHDKLRIAQRLDDFGVAYIEGGWPGSNPKDAEFFQRARDMSWKHARIAAFGATRRVGVAVEDDLNLRALLAAGTSVCTIFGKAWTRHVVEVLRTSLEDNLVLIEESVAYLKSHKRTVVFDAEHFFDGYQADSSYALAALEAAARGGADTLVLCDTNGGAMPWDVERVVRAVASEKSWVVPPLGVHCHNDGDCATANSIAAVRAGVQHVQGTVNGYGERCGNANLCAIIPGLELKLDHSCLATPKLSQLTEVAHFVAEIANLAPDDHMAYVGRAAFAHKGGVHVAAIRRSQGCYEHIEPGVVGNHSRVVVSELSGRGNLLSKAEEHAVEVPGPDEVSEVLQDIKNNEALGFSYEGAEASVALMLARKAVSYEPPYRLVDYSIEVNNLAGRPTVAQASVKIQVNGDIHHTAAQGDGPVNALDRALRKALLPSYPQLATIELEDYKVRILNSSSETAGTSATTRVFIYSSNGKQRWGTVGASSNIIDASWRALTDAVEYGLRLHAKALRESTERKRNAQ